MPRGPKGEKRPADVIGNAVHVKRIATGEIEDIIPDDSKDPAAKALGKKGGAARAKDMTPGAESWVIPVPVLLSVTVGVFAAFLGILYSELSVDLYARL